MSYNIWCSLIILCVFVIRSSDYRTSTYTEGTLCIKKIWTDAIRKEPRTNSSSGTEQHPPPSTISTPTASTGATVDNTVGTKSVCLTCGICSIIYVSLQLRVQNAVSAQPCVEKLQISLVLLNFLHCNFRLWFKTPQPFDSYPCHASEMTRNTLNHCLKFTLHSIFCHICYGKISEKNFNTFIKVKLLVSKTSDSCFQGFDFFQMLLASHR